MKMNLFVIAACCVFTACSDGSKIAKVNGKAVYQDSFDAYLEHKRISTKTDEQKDKVLDQYLQREALASIIEDTISDDNRLVLAELNELRKEVLISRYFDNYLKGQITDEAVRNYYNANIEKYEEKKVHVAHILLRLNKNMDETQKQVKSTTIQEAYSKLQAGADFSETAKNYSEDTVSAKKGGDLGWLPEGSIHKNFSEAAFSLNVGQMSKPIETSYGFHILKVLDAPAVNRKSYESVLGEIRYELRNAAKESERARLLKMIDIKKG